MLKETLRAIFAYFWGVLVIVTLAIYTIGGALLTIINFLIFLGFSVKSPEQSGNLTNPFVTAAITIIGYAFLKVGYHIWRSNALKRSQDHAINEMTARYPLPYSELPEDMRNSFTEENNNILMDYAKQNKVINDSALSCYGYAFLAGLFLILMQISHWLGYGFLVIVFLFSIFIFLVNRNERKEMNINS
jgi:Flp pilus assembly protein TadB